MSDNISGNKEPDKTSKKETIGKILFTRQQIEERAAQIGRQISEDYKGKSVVLVGILRGAVMWMAEVMKNLDLDVIIDFMAVSSYGSSKKSSGIVKINKDLDANIEGKHVIIIEDIIDSGITMNYLLGYIKARGAASIKICAMLDKKANRKNDINVDYIGFEVDDLFIIGYGLDYDHKYRNLPYISYLDEDK